MLAKPATEAWVTRTHCHHTRSSLHYGMQPVRCKSSCGVCHQDPGFSRGAKGFNSLTQIEKFYYWIYWTLGLNWFLRLPKYKSQCSWPWELACCCEKLACCMRVSLLQKNLPHHTMLSATQDCRYYKTFSSDGTGFPARTCVSGKETKLTFSGSLLGRWLQYLSGES